MVNHRPAVSVLLPTYRRPHLVGRAIRSVLSQTSADWELIVVDDASGDRTWPVLRQWAARDSRIRIFRQARGGGFKAYVTAFRKACGKFIALLNDDDEYLPRHLERRLEYFQQHPRVDFVDGRVRLVGPRSAGFLPDIEHPGRLIHLNRCHLGITFFMNRRAAAVALAKVRHHWYGDFSMVADVRHAGFAVCYLTAERYRTVRYYRDRENSVTHRWRRQLGR